MFWKAAAVQVRTSFAVLDHCGWFSFAVLILIVLFSAKYSTCHHWCESTKSLLDLLFFSPHSAVFTTSEGDWNASAVERTNLVSSSHLFGCLWIWMSVGCSLHCDVLALSDRTTLWFKFFLPMKIQNRRYHLEQQKPSSLWIITVIVSKSRAEFWVYCIKWLVNLCRKVLVPQSALWNPHWALSGHSTYHG